MHSTHSYKRLNGQVIRSDAEILIARKQRNIKEITL